METFIADQLPRLIACNGSRIMPADLVYTERDNTIREEGNAAHWLAMTVFKRQHTLEELTDRRAPNGVFITPEMVEYVGDYLSAIDRSPSEIREMEWSYTLTNQKWQINGRPDHISTNGHFLNIDDLKFGYSIAEPEMNWTLISHAIGYCVTTGFIPKKITFTIHQPRAPHYAGRVRSWPTDFDTLQHLHRSLTERLDNLTDVLNTGPHCYKCQSFAGCPARQNAELNAIEAAHIAYNAEIDNVDLAARLDQIERAMELLKQSKKAYEEQAAYRIKQAQVIANYGLFDDLANRSWREHVTPELIQALTGKDISEKKLPTPRQAELGGLDKEFVALFTERRSKGSKLVRMDANKRAKKLFGEK